MTVTFLSKLNGKTVEVKEVKDFKAGDSWLSTTGYGVHYTDGTYSLYSYTAWELAKVEQ
ncbi:MAG: hypothetical protein IKU44_04465 [Firmicutes bacterium]|nr:hypothetical protein [Bacillota bacterium]